jgi:hypothetical protein
MNFKEALYRARSAIEKAEEASDDSSRIRCLQMARDYLMRADLDEWPGRRRPAVIIALEEDGYSASEITE